MALFRYGGGKRPPAYPSQSKPPAAPASRSIGYPSQQPKHPILEFFTRKNKAQGFIIGGSRAGGVWPVPMESQLRPAWGLLWKGQSLGFNGKRLIFTGGIART